MKLLFLSRGKPYFVTLLSFPSIEQEEGDEEKGEEDQRR